MIVLHKRQVEARSVVECALVETFKKETSWVTKHFRLYDQILQAQGKLVRVARGSVFDVAVDIRKSSLDFGKWTGVELSEDNQRQLWIPPGFAHGFLVTSDSADFLYKTTDYYAPEFERSIAWDDAAIGIQWPLANLLPRLSAKDLAGAPLASAEVFD